ncbi:MAG: hypothetical protein HY608_12050 [Planctomycetes bacterium]|nr:hypothetical protein [Planctomycetota bacterium]
MPDDPDLGVYDLTILSRIVSRCRTLPELLREIQAYPEDTRREGRIREGMAAFALRFASFERLAEAVQALVAGHGGQQALDDLQERMESDEFMSGWPE